MVGSVPFTARHENGAADFKEPIAVFFGKFRIPLAERNRRKGEVAARAGNGVEFVFKRLKALFDLPQRVLAGNGFGLFFREPALFGVLLHKRRVGLFDVGKQYLIEFRK